jgi:glycosyltransferase involved in cell wall biosynthesis
VTPSVPRVSLLASTYRSGRFLPSWLESLETQTIWPETELVVVANDPSPDEGRLLSEFAKRNPQVRVLTLEREPLYRSWNRAMATTTAPLLGVANVDDLRTPSGLERQVDALEESPDALFCYGSWISSPEFPASGSVNGSFAAAPFDREEFTRSMLVGPFFIWRRSDNPAIRFFDEQLEVGGDFDLAIRLALHGRGIPVNENLGTYYDGGTGLSTAGERQPIERTVLELRYGIYDKLDFSYVPQAAEYTISQLLQPDANWLPVAEVVPDYEEFLRARRERWYRPPRRGFIRRRLRP